MTKLVFIIFVVGVGVAFATEPLVDRDPGAVPSSGVNPHDTDYGFGSIICSFPCMAYPGGVVNTYDGYVITGHWGTSFNEWYVYTEAGALVRTVGGLSGNTGGFRGGSARNHLGDGYIVSAQFTGGCKCWEYSAGGNPGTAGMPLGIPACGRGISWDGIHYYATVGTYGTPIGIYTSNGSLVGTVPGDVHTMAIYDFTAAFPRNGYLYGPTQGPNIMREVDLLTGSITRSFSLPGVYTGCDMDWDTNTFWSVHQEDPGYLYNYTIYIMGVEPESLGKIKAIYR